MERCVIVGAGHAAANLVLALRRNGWEGKITVISEEYFLPYQRPPLSKGFLIGENQIDNLYALNPVNYRDAEVGFFLGVKACRIDRERKEIELSNGECLSYTKLVLATGSRVRKLAIPGVDLNGVHYLRNISDAQQIRSRIGKGKRAVIVGGGYVGLEVAAALRSRGMEVTVLEAASRILERVTAPEVSAFYTSIHSDKGVEIITQALVERIEGEKSVERVICSNGKTFQADLVVIGVGVVPAVELAEDAGLAVENGIVVDEYARTIDLDILAAGDCTSHYNPIYDRYVRLESVQNANDQAAVVARTICNDLQPYHALPWFWSDQYNLKLQIAGLSEGYEEVIVRGDVKNQLGFSAFYFKDDRVLAVDAVNRPQEFIVGKKLITEKRPVDKLLLADEGVPMKAFIY